MKKYWFLLLLPALVFFACSNDDDDDWENYRINIATVENPDNSAGFYLRLDNDRVLKIKETVYPNYKPKTGQRILAAYTLQDNKEKDESYDYNIRLYDAYNVLTKDIFNITPATQDSIGNDPVGIREMWIGSNYLNVRFYYQGYGRTHFINLVKDDSKEYQDGKTHLEFRHNANGDIPYYWWDGIASFNLLSLVVEPYNKATNVIDLAIHVKDFNGNDRVFNLKYDYANKDTTNKDFSRDTFNEGKDRDIQ